LTPCLQLFFIFFKIGAFAYGGGYVILPMIYQDIQSFGLMPAAEFSNVVALSQMTPGPVAINAATYVGYQYAGLGGATAATLGVVMPSLIFILLVSVFLDKFRTSRLVQAVFAGIRPATVGMMAAAVYFFAMNSIFDAQLFTLAGFRSPLAHISLPAMAIFAAVVFLSLRWKWNPILLTVLGGIAGVLLF